MKWTKKYIEMGSGSKDYTVTRNLKHKLRIND